MHTGKTNATDRTRAVARATTAHKGRSRSINRDGFCGGAGGRARGGVALAHAKAGGKRLIGTRAGRAATRFAQRSQRGEVGVREAFEQVRRLRAIRDPDRRERREALPIAMRPARRVLGGVAGMSRDRPHGRTDRNSIVRAGCTRGARGECALRVAAGGLRTVRTRIAASPGRGRHRSRRGARHARGTRVRGSGGEAQSENGEGDAGREEAHAIGTNSAPPERFRRSRRSGDRPSERRGDSMGKIPPALRVSSTKPTGQSEIMVKSPARRAPVYDARGSHSRAQASDSPLAGAITTR